MQYSILRKQVSYVGHISGLFIVFRDVKKRVKIDFDQLLSFSSRKSISFPKLQFLAPALGHTLCSLSASAPSSYKNKFPNNANADASRFLKTSEIPDIYPEWPTGARVPQDHLPLKILNVPFALPRVYESNDNAIKSSQDNLKHYDYIS
jgi:hypothetical protein